ncbi:hypothetical protein [Erysipelothrix aquatica]|uniref:hypothetical protein n=1 Tax=Erysipelothrix aquatica TaxID=2683714 RepID=UPI00135B4AC4|nr:hypothetical protein [Erysipelothrix aquatica]
MNYFKRMLPVLGAAVVATLIYFLSLLFDEPVKTVIIGIGALVFLSAIFYTFFTESIQAARDVRNTYRNAKGKKDD